MAKKSKSIPLEDTGALASVLAARGEEIRKAREARGWSQAALGAKAGTSQQTVDRIEKGFVRHTRWLQPLQAALDIPHLKPASDAQLNDVPPALLRGADAVFTYTDDRPHYDLTRELLEARESDASPFFVTMPIYPIYTQVEQVIGRRAVDFIERPAPLARVPGAYGAVVFGEEMEPALRPGDTILLNPYLPPRAKNDLLLFGPPGSPRKVIIATLVDQDRDHWVVEQYRPPAQFSLPKQSWQQAHVVIGKFSNT